MFCLYYNFLMGLGFQHVSAGESLILIKLPISALLDTFADG